MSARNEEASGVAGNALICLDARLPPTAAVSGAVGPPRRCPREAGFVLDHAREKDWLIGHLLSGAIHDTKVDWIFQPGLRPAPGESVFYKAEGEALVAGALERFLRSRDQALYVIVGRSTDSIALRLAMALRQAGKAVQVVRDALMAPTHEIKGLESLAKLPTFDQENRVRLVPAQALTHRRSALRVIVGGRSREGL